MVYHDIRYLHLCTHALTGLTVDFFVTWANMLMKQASALAGLW